MHFSITIDQGGDIARWYTDGIQRATRSDNNGAVDWLLKQNDFPLGVGGGLAGGAIAFRGHLDEVRVSATVRSADWIAAEYENQRATGCFMGVSIR